MSWQLREDVRSGMRDPEWGARGFDRFVPQFADCHRKWRELKLRLWELWRDPERPAELHGQAHER